MPYYTFKNQEENLKLRFKLFQKNSYAPKVVNKSIYSHDSIAKTTPNENYPDWL